MQTAESYSGIDLRTIVTATASRLSPQEIWNHR